MRHDNNDSGNGRDGGGEPVPASVVKQMTLLAVMTVIVIVTMNSFVVYVSFNVSDRQAEDAQIQQNLTSTRNEQFQNLLENQEEMIGLLTNQNRSR